MEPQSQKTETAAALYDVLRALRRRWSVIVICALIVPSAALAYALVKPKEYSASASLLFRDPQLDQKLFGSTVFTPSTDPTREAATNVKLVSLETVAGRTSQALKGAISPAEVQSKVSVASDGQSNLASIMATDRNPAFAAKLADTFANEYIGFRRDADRSKIASAEQLVQQQLNSLSGAAAGSAQARTLHTQSEQLQVLAALQTGNAELVQPAQVPGSPSSPKPAQDTMIGLVVGLMMGVGLALLLERLDRRLKDANEISEAFNRPVLGAIPESRSLEKRQGAVQIEPAETEAFRMLRTNLRYFNVDRTIKTVLITSAMPAEGKSTVGMHLALTAAGSGERVLLLEADLRRPTIGSRFGLGLQQGLSQVLAGTQTLASAVQQVSVAEMGIRGAGDRVLDVLPAGPIPPNPSDLVESERMRHVIREAERHYDFIVLDSPPTSVVSDAIPLVKDVTGVIVVCRLGRATRESTEHLQQQLENLDANLLGVVINSIGRGSGGRYGYGYGYGYGGYPYEPDEATPTLDAHNTRKPALEGQSSATTRSERDVVEQPEHESHSNGLAHSNGYSVARAPTNRNGGKQPPTTTALGAPGTLRQSLRRRLFG